MIEDNLKTLASSGGIDKVQNVLTTQLTSKSINLGAPILNVQVSSTKATDKTAAASTSTATVTTTTTTPVNTFNPTNPIVKDDIVPVVKPIVLPTNQAVPQHIYNTTTIEIVKEQKEAPVDNTLMIAVIASIVGVIVVGGVVGFFIYKFNRSNVIAEKAH